MDEYLKDYKKQFGNNYPKFMENWILHDCDVVSSNFVKNDIILKIDNSGGYTKINEIRFKNAKVIKQDKDLKNLCWLYDEIYKKGDNYEIHVLFGSYNDAKTYDFIIECSDVECKLEKG